MNVEKLIKLGSQLALKGEGLRIWVEQQIKEEAEQKEKEAAIREREAQAAREDREREAAIREREAALKEREIHAASEARERETEAQRVLLEKQLELERLKIESPVGSPGGNVLTRTQTAKSPRLPPFNDTKDENIDSYLLRFERYATVNLWPRTDWALHLSALLTGRALEVYTRMEIEDAQDYEKLRDALLVKYNLTEEGFCIKFRQSRPENSERMSEFKTRIASYLEKWIELSGKDRSKPAEIIDLFLKEQLMKACGKDLQTFLKERKPKTAEEVANLAENYIEAHGMAKSFNRHSGGTGDKGKVHESVQQKPQVKPTAVTCHKCGRVGHFARDCRVRQFVPEKRQVSAVFADGACSYCGRKGHEVSKCWERNRKLGNQRGKEQKWGSGEPKRTDQVDADSKQNVKNSKCVGHEGMELKCGCCLPIVSSMCLMGENEAPKMPVAMGWINGRRVRVLRDSGCSCVVVKKGLIPPSEVKGEKVMVYLADGTTVLTPLTEVDLDCPYYKGKVVAVEM